MISLDQLPFPAYICYNHFRKEVNRMQIPSFGSFLESMGGDYIQKISNSHEDIIKGTYSPLLEGGLSELMTATVACSTAISLDILKDYHEWLRKQFDRQS